MICKLVVVLSLAMAIQAAPQLPPGINPAVCPNYPFCGPSPQAAPGAPQSAVSINHATHFILHIFLPTIWGFIAVSTCCIRLFHLDI